MGWVGCPQLELRLRLFTAPFSTVSGNSYILWLQATVSPAHIDMCRAEWVAAIRQQYQQDNIAEWADNLRLLRGW